MRLLIILLLSLQLWSQAERLTVTTGTGEIEITPLCFSPSSNSLAFADSSGIIRSAKLGFFDNQHHDQLVACTSDLKQWNAWSNTILPEPTSYPPIPPRGLQLIGWDKSDRAYIQSFNQSDYGKKASDCVPNSFVNTAQWWDAQKFVTFPQQRKLEKQIEWLHTTVARAAGTRNNSGTHYDGLRAGLADISKRYLDNRYVFPFFKVPAPDIEKLAFYTTGNTAACLSISVYYNNKYQSGHSVTLIEVTSNGKIKFNTWGEKFSGILKPYKLQNNQHAGITDAQAYEIELYNQNELPEWMLNYEVSFKLEPARHNHLYLTLPYKKLTVGDTWAPHPEVKNFRPTPKAITTLTQPAQTSYKPEPQVNFERQCPPLLDSWYSTTGKTMKALLIATNGNELSFKKGSRTLKLPFDQLSLSSQCKALLWDGANGKRRELPACTLIYQLRQNRNLTQNITIHYDGSSRAIAIIPMMNREVHYDHEPLTFKVYRTPSNELIATGSPVSSSSEPSITAKQLEQWHPASVTQFTGRFIQSPQFPSGNLTMGNISAPPIAALLSILNGKQISYEDGHFGFHFPAFKINSFSHYPTVNFELERALKLAHYWEMLPLKLQWTSKVSRATGQLQLIKITPLKDGLF
jgi:hypothetical protein